ncbi:MAG: hypothetical protein MZV64_33025 [Ignavibacteriales bacterium]|nr:hypothetical protein [Ignavibacteriales bacterium]
MHDLDTKDRAHPFREICGRRRDRLADRHWRDEPDDPGLPPAAGAGRQHLIRLRGGQQLHRQPLLDLSRFALETSSPPVGDVLHRQRHRHRHPHTDPEISRAAACETVRKPGAHFL